MDDLSQRFSFLKAVHLPSKFHQNSDSKQPFNEASALQRKSYPEAVALSFLNDIAPALLKYLCFLKRFLIINNLHSLYI
jgi:hypothetical protein